VHLRPSGRTLAVPPDGLGLDKLMTEVRARTPALVVLEATGGFEITVVAALANASLPLAIVNPRQIRKFARATGRLAKTDRLAAEVIALFAERMLPEPRPVPSDAARRLGSSPVKNAEHGAIPWVSGRRKYSRLQGSCLEPAKSLQIRAPGDACRAA
jgi:transposase